MGDCKDCVKLQCPKPKPCQACKKKCKGKEKKSDDCKTCLKDVCAPCLECIKENCFCDINNKDQDCKDCTKNNCKDKCSKKKEKKEKKSAVRIQIALTRVSKRANPTRRKSDPIGHVVPARGASVLFSLRSCVLCVGVCVRGALTAHGTNSYCVRAVRKRLPSDKTYLILCFA